jgi:hypothetical protein
MTDVFFKAIMKATKDQGASLAVALADGADVNAIVDGDTPLMFALRLARRSPVAISMLLSAGADVDVEVGGLSAAYIAIANHDDELLRILLAAGADASARVRGDDDAVQALSLLVHACVNRSWKCASLLLSAGAVVEPNSGDLLRQFHSFPFDETDTMMWKAIQINPLVGKREIELVGFGQCRRRLFEVCVGLQENHFPAPVLIEIVESACEPFARQLPYFYLWNAVTAVLHFHQREHVPFQPPFEGFDFDFLIEEARVERLRVLTECVCELNEVKKDEP